MRARLPHWIAFIVLGALLAGCDGSTKAATQTDIITIVNYNILHGLYDEDAAAPRYDRFLERLELLAQELARLRPEVIVLQEVVLRGPRDYPDVRATLRAALGDEYSLVFAEAGSDAIDEGALGRMTLTRLPLVSSANRPVFPGRSAHRVTVRTKGGVLDIYNVHLEGPELFGLQALETARLLRFIDASRRNLNPVLLAGDFNSRPDDQAIVSVLEGGFIDVLAAKRDVTCAKRGDPGCTRMTRPILGNNPRNDADMRIDYMFARSGTEHSIRILSAEPFLDSPMRTEDGRLLWLSDHIGIKATIEVERKLEIGPRR